MSYQPAYHGQLTSGDPLGSKSCVAYAFSYAIDAATEGASKPSGRQVREATGDTSGGLELAQCASVAKSDYELLVTTGVFNRSIFESRMASGVWGAVLIGGYGPIAHSAYTGEPGFLGNHAVYVEPKNVVMDPLADGRRAGIYKFSGAPYPLSLIRGFAAALRLSNGNQAGPDHFEATLFPLPSNPLHPQVRAVTGRFETYTVHNSGIGGVGGRLRTVGHSTRQVPANTIYACSASEFPVFVGTVQIPMRQLHTGPFAGLWVTAHGNLRYSQ